MWTHENHAIEIYNNQFTFQKLKYKHDNPIRAAIVKDEEILVDSSVVNDAGEKAMVDTTVLHYLWLMLSYAGTAQPTTAPIGAEACVELRGSFSLSFSS